MAVYIVALLDVKNTDWGLPPKAGQTVVDRVL